MAGFIFEEGDEVDVGYHGDHDYVYAEASPVIDKGKSSFVFESGTGIRGGDLIDSFEDGDINEYNGRTNDYSVQSDTSTAIDGGQYLKGDASGTANNNIYSLNGLDTYPSRGDTFRVNLQFNVDREAIDFQWGYQGDSRSADTYGVELNMENSEFRLGIGKGNNPTTDTLITKTPVNYSSYVDTWLVLEVEWGDPTITATLYEADSGGTPDGSAIVSVSGDDTTYDQGGIGFLVDSVGSGGITGLFDYARVI